MPPRTLVVTAAAESFTPLLRGLIGSLHQWADPPYTDIACFDLGLSDNSVNWVKKHARHVIPPEWDLPVDPALQIQKPHLRALTARPFLPRYFPGYDIYLWIDTDAWVQQRYAINRLVAAASGGAMAIAPEIHLSYRQTREGFQWRMGRLQAYFGEARIKQALWQPYFNAGVFALPARALHWQMWAQRFREGLTAMSGMLCCDQTALNYAIWTDGLPVAPLPATCNWLCHLARPTYDPRRQLLCEPMPSGRPIGIIHLSAVSKNPGTALPHTHSEKSADLRFPGRTERHHRNVTTSPPSEA